MQALAFASSGWIAASVGAVASLGIADVLAKGPQTVEALAAATNTDPYALTRVMNALVAVGLFRQGQNGHLMNTDDAEFLRTDHPESIRYQCLLFAGDYQRVFCELAHTLKTGEPASRKVLGGSLYAFLERSPESAEIYDRAMEDLARSAANALVASRDFAAVDEVVDVGGGRGILLKTLLLAHPRLRGTSFDRLDVCTRARRGLETEHPELVGRLTFTAGSFFESIPEGAALYTMKNVLHNWNDESCVKILRVAGAALARRQDARLLVIEPVVESRMHPMYKIFDDLMQIVVCEPGVVARSEAQYRALIECAGLVVTTSKFLTSGHCVLEAGAAPLVRPVQIANPSI
jgi:C-methyltransferase